MYRAKNYHSMYKSKFMYMTKLYQAWLKCLKPDIEGGVWSQKQSCNECMWWKSQGQGHIWKVMTSLGQVKGQGQCQGQGQFQG